MTIKETEEQLCARWEQWCLDQGLECESADEFACNNDHIMTHEQKVYVSQFIQTWEDLMSEMYG